MEYLLAPWPWWVGGPLLGLSVPLMMYLAGKQPGLAMVFKTTCSIVSTKLPFFNYDWKSDLWRFYFVGGIAIGGFIGGYLLGNPDPVNLNPATIADLQSLGVKDFTTIIPEDLFSLSFAFSPKGFILLLIGGFLIGFGSRYADGCTSGHAIMGLAHFQLPSLIAVIGFFAGGLFMTHVLLAPLLGWFLK